jgi:hypothetical protein
MTDGMSGTPKKLLLGSVLFVENGLLYSFGNSRSWMAIVFNSTSPRQCVVFLAMDTQCQILQLHRLGSSLVTSAVFLRKVLQRQFASAHIYVASGSGIESGSVRGSRFGSTSFRPRPWHRNVVDGSLVSGLTDGEAFFRPSRAQVEPSSGRQRPKC